MNPGNGNPCVIIMLRVPEKGTVKTRISRDLSVDKVLELYKNFVKDVLTSVKKTALHTLVFFYPDKRKDLLKKWLGLNFKYFPQKGENLGDRMQNAFLKAFSLGFDQATLIGTDCPELSDEIIIDSFKGIDEKGAVIGPAKDGGYYLIGFKKNLFDKIIFTDIPWGSGDVFRLTMDKFQKMNWPPFILPELQDMDTIDELKAYKHRGRTNISKTSYTLKFLNTIDI